MMKSFVIIFLLLGIFTGFVCAKKWSLDKSVVRQIISGLSRLDPLRLNDTKLEANSSTQGAFFFSNRANILSLSQTQSTITGLRNLQTASQATVVKLKKGNLTFKLHLNCVNLTINSTASFVLFSRLHPLRVTSLPLHTTIAYTQLTLTIKMAAYLAATPFVDAVQIDAFDGVSFHFELPIGRQLMKRLSGALTSLLNGPVRWTFGYLVKLTLNNLITQHGMLSLG